jgi:hypothetical protein
MLVRELVGELDERELLHLVSNIGGGLHDAGRAAECVTEPDRHGETSAQLAHYLTCAIVRLEAARELVRRRA